MDRIYPVVENKNDIVNIIITLVILVVLLFTSILVTSLVQKHKERTLNQYYYYQEELFNALGSNIDDIYIIYNVMNQKFEYVSPNFEKSVGFSRDALINDYQKLMEYMPAASREKILVMLAGIQMKVMTEVEFEYTHQISRELRYMLIRVYPVYQNEQLFRYVACIADITKEKAAQKALEDALEKLKGANEAKKDFLSHISHELKTPINAIIGMTQIAANSIDDTEKTVHCLKRINYASGKLLEMINNILDISKIDSNKLILEYKTFSLHDMIDQLIQIIEVQAELHQQEFICKTDMIQDDYLIGDEIRVLQIISNCLSNAIKFTPAGGKISFEVIETGRYDDQAAFRFIITDTGKGMSHEYLDRIFVPFEQEDSSIAKKYGGTGLGMSITYSLLTLMGGTIHIDSTPEMGTSITIEITFPVSNDYDYKVPLQKDIGVMSEYDYSGRHILVVEDNEINKEIIQGFLKPSKLEIVTASDGYEAIKLFEASEPGYFDIILMDLVMPGMDGYDTSRAIRASSHPDAGKVCIIAMTADNFAEHNKSLEYGMDYHITKPFDLNLFYEIINRVMSADREKYQKESAIDEYGEHDL